MLHRIMNEIVGWEGGRGGPILGEAQSRGNGARPGHVLLLGPPQLQSDAAGDQRGPKAPANSRDHTASSLTSFLPSFE